VHVRRARPTHATHAHPIRGEPLAEPTRHKVEVQFQGHLIDEELVKWVNIKEIANQGRNMETMGYGLQDGFEDLQRLVMSYAQQNLEKVVRAVEVYGVGEWESPERT
jgi:hypothetical protein